MEQRLHVQPLGLLARMADVLMIPIMYLLSLSLEKPQRTHRWNNTKLTSADVEFLDDEDMVHCDGIPSAGPRFRLGIPAFHLPIFGGWREYVVLEPSFRNDGWHVGWVTDDAVGVSRIEIHGPVRVLLGPGDVSFFGVTSTEGVQVQLRQIGNGRVGERGSYSHVPLL